MPIGTTILFYGDFSPFTKKQGWGGGVFATIATKMFFLGRK
jgi:hypothetical protein